MADRRSELEQLLDGPIPPVTIAGELVDRLMRGETVPERGEDPLARGDQVGEFVWTTPTGKRRRYTRIWRVNTFVLTPLYRR